MKKSTIIAALAVVLAGVSINSYAGTATSNLTVSAEIAANCTISTTAVAFGGYDPIVTNKSTALTNSAGKVTTICTNGSAVTVTLGQGLNADTGSTDAIPLRRLASAGTPANKLSYFLYSNAGFSTVWSSTGVADTGTGVASDLTVYGSMPANQNKPVGADYADTVVATVTF